jgi:hypothetical protein
MRKNVSFGSTIEDPRTNQGGESGELPRLLATQATRCARKLSYLIFQLDVQVSYPLSLELHHGNVAYPPHAGKLNADAGVNASHSSRTTKRAMTPTDPMTTSRPPRVCDNCLSLLRRIM